MSSKKSNQNQFWSKRLISKQTKPVQCRKEYEGEREREHLWASIPWISWCAWPSVFALRMNGNKSWLLKEPAQMWTRVNDSSVFHTHRPMNSHWPLWWCNYVTWNNKKVEGCRHFLSPYLVRLFLFLPFFFSGGWDVPWAPKKKAPKNISWERQEKKTPWFVKIAISFNSRLFCNHLMIFALCNASGLRYATSWLQGT